jgi:hypothetical protein
VFTRVIQRQRAIDVHVMRSRDVSRRKRINQLFTMPCWHVLQCLRTVGAVW